MYRYSHCVVLPIFPPPHSTVILLTESCRMTFELFATGVGKFALVAPFSCSGLLILLTKGTPVYMWVV